VNRRALALLACLLGAGARAEEFTFDSAEFAKKPFEFGGYFELKAERAWLNRDGAFYQLNFFDQKQRDTLDRKTGTLKLDGKLTQGIASLKLRANAEVRSDDLATEHSYRFDEAYLSLKPNPGITLDAGKVALNWGKGYAWNPVGFVQRAKDPNDVELAREGYTMATADFIRNFEGDLKTIAFTPVVLPVRSQTNQDFGTPDHLNVAAKLYLLYRDTDIDFTWLGNGSRTPRFGIDFSRNLSSALEVHGEWARIWDYEQRSVGPTGAITTSQRDATSYLLGLRYLTERDTTWIAEYYRNGTGYTESQSQDFYRLAGNGYSRYRATGNGALLNMARQASQSYARPYAGERYAYLRASQKEPFDIVYFTPSLTLIANLADHSWTLTPELLYTGVTNLDLRLRAAWLKGGAGTEFDEKQNARRLELMARFYF
jgi:hypothetical protein